jgi:microcompartment protein CcmK/EutM
MLLVRPIDPMTQKPLGDAMMAVEGGVGAGPGSVVLVMDEGSSARSVMKDDKAPVRTIVVAIVDAVSSGGKVTKYD